MKPVTQSRDTQELWPDAAAAMLQAFWTLPCTYTTLMSAYSTLMEPVTLTNSAPSPDAEP